MHHITGTNRQQSTLFPEVLDDFITAENPVRFIDAYADSLDLKKLGFTHAEPLETGRPPYHPADLLKLYIYGYLNRIRSSRLLEQATHRNVEVMWLLGRLYPDFKTIADFRKNNIASLKKVCREFTLLCKRLDLFGGELIGIDGSKFSAVNHNNRYYTKKKLEKALEKIDKKIDAYMTVLDARDQEDATYPSHSVDGLQEKIVQLEQQKIELATLQEQLISSEQTQIALTDPDSRMMRASTGRKDMSYNVQIVTDAKHKLIVAYEVTNEMNDRNMLSKMALEAKEILGSQELDVVADAGYYNVEEIKKCDEHDIRGFVPTPEQPNGKQFSIREFQYEATSDRYVCPQGEYLIFHRRVLHEKKRMRIYQGTVCGSCHIRSQCTRSKEKNRSIYRWEHEPIIEKMRARCLKESKKMEMRKALVEHPFGTIKQWMDQRYFLLRGKANVGGEFALSVLAYNIKRVLNILGVTTLLEMIGYVAKEAPLLG